MSDIYEWKHDQEGTILWIAFSYCKRLSKLGHILFKIAIKKNKNYAYKISIFLK